MVRAAAALASFVVVLAALIAGKNLIVWQKIESALAEAAPPAPYRIERDEYGVPSVYGKTDAAVAFGLAYAHAEDDFATIQQRIAPIKGQSAALNGQEGAVVDVVGRMVQARRVTALSMDRLTPEARAMADGYASGINAYAHDHPEEILRKELFPVTGEDVVAGFVLVAPFFYGLDGVLEAVLDGSIEAEPASSPAEARGSNAFAIAPSRRPDGSTVLISNSHQPWEGVAAWYEARVASGEGWSVAGPLFPGVPFVLMGYNEHLSWTNTVNVPDLTDVYRLEMDESGRRYRFGEEWRELEEERVWLKVKMGPFILPVPRSIYFSVHGPAVKTDSGVYAVRYAGMGEVRSFEQYYRLNRAKSFSDWEDAMRMQHIVSTNFIYADAEGNIAYLYNASFPKRSADTDWSGVLPGDDPDLLWTAYEPFENIPYYVNPSSGWLVNANNTPFLATAERDTLDPDDFSELVGIEPNVTNRITRAIALMRAHAGPFTDEVLDEIKYDKGYDRGSPLGQAFDALVRDERLEEVDAEAHALLRRFDDVLDGEGEADAIGALVVYNLYLGLRGWHDMPTHEAALTEAAEHLRTHFGRLDPPLGELSRLRRGEADLPLYGGPDALRAIYWGFDEDGRMHGLNGDGYIAYVRWSADGELDARTIYPFGAAMGRPGSPHYADQAELFAAERLKPAPLPDWRKAAALQ
jgi:acyl-homoserine-lactone acylase